jgi:hypothetical protein
MTYRAQYIFRESIEILIFMLHAETYTTNQNYCICYSFNYYNIIRYVRMVADLSRFLRRSFYASPKPQTSHSSE